MSIHIAMHTPMCVRQYTCRNMPNVFMCMLINVSVGGGCIMPGSGVSVGVVKSAVKASSVGLDNSVGNASTGLRCNRC